MRTNATDVKLIMDNVTIADTIVDTYILAANTMVNKVLGTSTTDLMLTEIERWLAAHMIAVTRERQAKKEGAGGAYIEYAGDFGAGLSSTSYGQMVVMLDTTGLMAATSGKAASIHAVKTE